ncbi:histidine kinase dimerization/phospho-acceptor domain-containing protein [Paenibacillus cremeus]|nr:histidine kinase dimerization/phospho-acceptor domain-containing protein [Paenibacillus cremeus]
MTTGGRDRKTGFEGEMQVLEAARQVAARSAYKDNELLPHYEELLSEFERLLRTTSKIYRISDLQGDRVKKQEDELKRVYDQLKQMESSRRGLVRDISHELNTPMTSIQGYVKAMLDGVIVPDRAYLATIYQKLLLINGLVDTLFEMSKLESELPAADSKPGLTGADKRKGLE